MSHAGGNSRTPASARKLVAIEWRANRRVCPRRIRWPVPELSLSVLVVEDHPDFRQVLGVFLDILGYRAELAADTGTALVWARDKEFDVLLTDIHLPGMDGWELIGELIARGDLPPLVISMSAGNTGTEAARSKLAGCRAHLVKPF